MTADVVLASRPAEAADRAVPGHWEGDVIIGTGRSAIGTLVERHSRATIVVHLPRLDGWGEQPPVKNGTSLGGYGAIAMNQALTTSVATLPQQLRKTITWDRGKELSGHAAFTLATGTRVFFADPHSPWQRSSNENTNGLLRQYFPKGTDLSRWTATDLEAIAYTLNNRPRKVLGCKNPGRGLRRATTITESNWCYIHRLNPPCEPASAWPISSPRTTGRPSRLPCHSAIRSGTSTSSTARVGAAFQATIFWAKTSRMNRG